MLFGTDTTAVADMHHLQLMQLHCVSEKKHHPLLFPCHLCQMWTDFANTWREHATGNLKQTHMRKLPPWGTFLPRTGWQNSMTS